MTKRARGKNIYPIEQTGHVTEGTTIPTAITEVLSF